MADTTDPSKMGTEAKGALKRTGHSLLNLLVDILGPLFLFIFGFLSAAWLGGTNLFNNLLTSNGVSQAVSEHVAPLLPLGIAGVISGVFWHIGHEDGIIMKAIGKFTGAYFGGVALSYGIDAIFPRANTPNGALDSL